MTSEALPIANVDPVTGQSLVISLVEQAEPSHPGAQHLLAYWLECKAKGDFVMGRDVPARRIAALTKHLVVFEPATSSDFRYRLVGSILWERFGRNITGLSVSEVYDAQMAKSLNTLLSKAIELQMPVCLRVNVTGTLGDVFRPEAILLPIKASNGTSHWILMGLFYADQTNK
jgi:hypothetical protein